MIRIRHPQGTCSFNLNETSTTLADLQTYIQQQSNIAPADQELHIGYPPKPVQLAAIHASELLSSDALGIRKGGQVIVARKAGSDACAGTPSMVGAVSGASRAYGSASSFGAMGGPKPNISTATGPRSSGLGARTLQDALTAQNPPPPSSSTPASTKLTDSTLTIPIPSSQDHLRLKLIPDDNSCLFNSVGYVLQHRLGADVCQGLRQIVATAIRDGVVEYPEVVLGESRERYVSKMLRPQTWGGGIELLVLSRYFGVELDSIDVATGTVHRFGEDMGYENRAILVYSGIHYDAITLVETKEAGGESTIFPNLTAFGIAQEEDAVLEAAKQLCRELKQRGYYTDTASFALKCRTCGVKLTGEKEAVQHAKTTGHGDFGQV